MYFCKTVLLTKINKTEKKEINKNKNKKIERTPARPNWAMAQPGRPNSLPRPNRAYNPPHSPGDLDRSTHSPPTPTSLAPTPPLPPLVLDRAQAPRHRSLGHLVALTTPPPRRRRPVTASSSPHPPESPPTPIRVPPPIWIWDSVPTPQPLGVPPRRSHDGSRTAPGVVERGREAGRRIGE